MIMVGKKAVGVRVVKAMDEKVGERYQIIVHPLLPPQELRARV